MSKLIKIRCYLASKKLLKIAQSFKLLIAKSSVLHDTKPFLPFYHHLHHRYNLLVRVLFYSYTPIPCAAFIHYTSVIISSNLNPSFCNLDKFTAKGLSWSY